MFKGCLWPRTKFARRPSFRPEGRREMMCPASRFARGRQQNSCLRRWGSDLCAKTTVTECRGRNYVPKMLLEPRFGPNSAKSGRIGPCWPILAGLGQYAQAQQEFTDVDFGHISPISADADRVLASNRPNSTDVRKCLAKSGSIAPKSVKYG